jgi:predicted alternative tryptophan synthase beta-subunit
MALILQELSTEREIEIPEPIRDVYRMWRPSPLIRARRLEQALGRPAKSTTKGLPSSLPYNHRGVLVQKCSLSLDSKEKAP